MSDVRLVTTSGYCTEAVRDFVLGYAERHALLGEDSIVGIIGMGRIGYAIARRIALRAKRVVYCARRPRAGLDFTFLPLEELLAATDFIIVAATPEIRST